MNSLKVKQEQRCKVMSEIRCGCSSCKTVQHASSCAVHNAPALPKGKCNCGAELKDLRQAIVVLAIIAVILWL